MGRYYVDVTDVPQEILDFAGYVCIFDDPEFKILNHKGEFHLVDKLGKSYIFVDEMDDADVIRAFRSNPKIAITEE
jgi:hypothetical protein